MELISMKNHWAGLCLSSDYNGIAYSPVMRNYIDNLHSDRRYSKSFAKLMYINNYPSDCVKELFRIRDYNDACKHRGLNHPHKFSHLNKKTTKYDNISTRHTTSEPQSQSQSQSQPQLQSKKRKPIDEHLFGHDDIAIPIGILTKSRTKSIPELNFALFDNNDNDNNNNNGNNNKKKNKKKDGHKNQQRDIDEFVDSEM
jgi:hypothetical protein